MKTMQLKTEKRAKMRMKMKMRTRIRKRMTMRTKRMRMRTRIGMGMETGRDRKGEGNRDEDEDKNEDGDRDGHEDWDGDGDENGDRNKDRDGVEDKDEDGDGDGDRDGGRDGWQSTRTLGGVRARGAALGSSGHGAKHHPVTVPQVLAGGRHHRASSSSSQDSGLLAWPSCTPTAPGLKEEKVSTLGCHHPRGCRGRGGRGLCQPARGKADPPVPEFPVQKPRQGRRAQQDQDGGQGEAVAVSVSPRPSSCNTSPGWPGGHLCLCPNVTPPISSPGKTGARPGLCWRAGS